MFIRFAVFILAFTAYSNASSQNFEGMIMYKRTVYTGSIAFQRYYFGDMKLRIESEFFIQDSVHRYSSIYDFQKHTNQYYSSSRNDFSTTKRELVTSFSRDTTLPDRIILGYDTEAFKQEMLGIVLPFETTDAQMEIHQTRYLANSLKFKIPDGWFLDYIMVSHKDPRIALFLEERIQFNFPPGVPSQPYNYRREAIAIVPMKIPDHFFEIN